jgi:pSer/pThr/pTyr-binding forkhead associated (FHA) protein
LIPVASALHSVASMHRDTRAIAAQLLGQAAHGQVPQSGPRFLVVAGPDAGRSLPVTEGDTVGRGASAEVALHDPAASRNHLRIERREGQLAIVDLGSKNGVELNGRRVRDDAPLRDGDRVRVGETVLEAAGLLVQARPEPGGAAAARGAADHRVRRLRAGAALLLAAGVALVLAGL